MTKRNKPKLPDDYLRWLEPQLRDENGNPDKTYEALLRLMFERDFEVVVSMDDNRVHDGLELRVEFARELRFRPDFMQVLGAGTFLEVLIGLSRRLAFTAGGQAPGWAWNLLGNLGLQRMYDPITPQKRRKVREIMDVAIARTYAPNGTGGFFPLAWPDEDQTRIQLWYQMNAYIEELHPEH